MKIVTSLFLRSYIYPFHILSPYPKIHTLVESWRFFLLKIIIFQSLSNIKLRVRSHSFCMQLFGLVIFLFCSIEFVWIIKIELDCCCSDLIIRSVPVAIYFLQFRGFLLIVCILDYACYIYGMY